MPDILPCPCHMHFNMFFLFQSMAKITGMWRKLAVIRICGRESKKQNWSPVHNVDMYLFFSKGKERKLIPVSSGEKKGTLLFQVYSCRQFIAVIYFFFNFLMSFFFLHLVQSLLLYSPHGANITNQNIYDSLNDK